MTDKAFQRLVLRGIFLILLLLLKDKNVDKNSVEDWRKMVLAENDL